MLSKQLMHPNTLFYRYINDFLRSQFYCKHQIDVLTSGNVQLADILYNETAFFYFMEVCILLAIVIFMRKVWLVIFILFLLVYGT